eukprot:Transcript_8739.p1 GENE.Transcript_8739~~Transcript_8739.p1  ORF type:complete len:203 (-),score=26.51 Transcript_8739:144-752(-)
MLPAARSMLPASQLARTTVRLCTTSRYEWQTLASGLRWKQVCVSLRLSPWPGHSRLLHGRSQVAHGNQGDHPVGDNQTVRISYSARVDETDTEVVSNRVASFKVGTRSQICEALDEGVRGMRVGDRRLLRAPFNMARGPAVAAAPAKAAIEYDVLLTGSVHHMTIVTLEKPGNEDPLQKLWNAGQRTLDSMLSAASRGKGGS